MTAHRVALAETISTANAHIHCTYGDESWGRASGDAVAAAGLAGLAVRSS